MNLANRYRSALYPIAASLLFVVCLGVSVAFAQSTVNVRAGIHERFERLVFDWAEKTNYEIKESGNSVTIQFSRPANLNAASIKKTNLKLIDQFSYNNNNKGLEVKFIKANSTSIQAFWSGTKVAFDILKLSNKPTSFSNSTSKKQSRREGPQEPRVIKNAPDEKLKKISEEATEMNKKFQGQRLSDLNMNAETNSGAVPEDETIISFQPPMILGAAAFVRNNALWVVFDDVLSSVSPEVVGQYADDLTTAKRISVKDATVYEFDLPLSADQLNFNFTKKDLTWSVSFGPKVQETGQPLSIESDFVTRPSDPRLVVGLNQDNVKVVRYKDPVVGDVVTVATMRTPSSYIPKRFSTPDLQLIPTIHGVTLVTFSDEIELSYQEADQSVMIKGRPDSPLKLSAETDRLSHIKSQELEEDSGKLFKMRRWYGEPGKSFNKKRTTLESRLLKLEGVEKAVGFIDLARLYITHGFGAEALGIMRIAQSVSPDLQKSLDFISLRGVAHALAGDRQSALSDLLVRELSDEEEANLWLGYVYGRDKEWPLAIEAFSKSGDILNEYPEPIRIKIALIAAEADLQADQIASASRHLQSIRVNNENLPLSDKAAYTYLQAKLLMESKKEDLAINAYKKVAKSRDRLYRAKSEYDLVPIEFERGDITVEEAIERLEKQRFAWRGDRLEVLIMERLSEYYVKSGDYFPALSLLRNAAIYSSNQEDRDRIAAKMAKMFSELFVGRKADELPPLKALSLYNAFKELTPIGEEGKKTLRYLSERLRQVDLLTEAERILIELVRFRTEGVEKAEVGAELAAVQLLLKKPDQALKSLEESELESDDKLPERLFEQRKVLLAKALADSGEIDKALDILRWDASLQAMNLKADINWQAGNWSDTARIIDRLIRRKSIDGVDKSEEEEVVNLILRRGIALALFGNQRALNDLQEQYGDLMAQSGRGDAFKIITQPITVGGLTDLQNLQQKVTNVDLFQNFLNDFQAGEEGTPMAEPENEEAN